jgi:hypothetical protein
MRYLTWLKQNWLKVILIIGIAVFIFWLNGHDFISLPKTDISPSPVSNFQNKSFTEEDLSKIIGIDFKDYPVKDMESVFSGKPAKPDLDSSPIGHLFKTRLTEGAVNGPNFAGHYTIVLWGCGIECQHITVVDAYDGKIYDIPFKSNSDVDFRIDSRLIIVNPVFNNGQPGYDINYRSHGFPEDLYLKYYEWTDNDFKLLKSYKTNDLYKQMLGS